MSPELDAKLCEKYPKIFTNRNGNMQETAMCWGMEHGDGWYNILDKLCGMIQNHIDYAQKQHSHDIAYNAMILDMVKGNFDAWNEYTKSWKSDYAEALKNDLIECATRNQPQVRDIRPVVVQVVADQVKEKYGTLRFYYGGGDDYIDGLVSMAEEMSSVTCETCGKPGKLRGGTWLYTACDEHTRDYDKTE